MQSLTDEFTRLLPHTNPTSNRIIGTGTIAPIRKHSIPQGRKITYANFICDYRPQKAETHRVRMTAGGDRLDYPDDPSSPAVSILNTKIHINRTISDAKKGSRYMTMDVNFFTSERRWNNFNAFESHNASSHPKFKKHTTSSSKSMDIPILKSEKECTV